MFKLDMDTSSALYMVRFLARNFSSQLGCKKFLARNSMQEMQEKSAMTLGVNTKLCHFEGNCHIKMVKPTWL